MPSYQYRGAERDAPPQTTAAAAKAGLIPVERIMVHEHNVRRDLGDLRELADSIREHGIVTPLVLERRGEMFRVRDGHRRYAAAVLVGLQRVPAFVHTTALDDREWVVNAVQANHRRRGLTNAERVAIVERLRGEGMSWDDVAAEFGVSASAVRRWVEKARTAPGPQPGRRFGSTARLDRVRGLVRDLRPRADAMTAAEVLDALEQILRTESTGPGATS